mmetsp:Transcript_44484/g.137319  ORF Transcript_44484/g.137319 Transcript_44484/m.137319 type:complete len:269 (+) Transcript_44484:133-939(+)
MQLTRSSADRICTSTFAMSRVRWCATCSTCARAALSTALTLSAWSPMASSSTTTSTPASGRVGISADTPADPSSVTQKPASRHWSMYVISTTYLPVTSAIKAFSDDDSCCDTTCVTSGGSSRVPGGSSRKRARMPMRLMMFLTVAFSSDVSIDATKTRGMSAPACGFAGIGESIGIEPWLSAWENPVPARALLPTAWCWGWRPATRGAWRPSWPSVPEGLGLRIDDGCRLPLTDVGAGGGRFSAERTAPPGPLEVERTFERDGAGLTG